MANAIRFDNTGGEAYLTFDYSSTPTVYFEAGIYIPADCFTTMTPAMENFPDLFWIKRTGASALVGTEPETDDLVNWDEWFTHQGFISAAPIADAVQIHKGFWNSGTGYVSVDADSLPFSTTTRNSDEVRVGLIGGGVVGVTYATYVKVGSTDGGSDLLDFDAATAPDLSAFSSVVGDVTLASVPSGGDTTPPALVSTVVGGRLLRLTYDEALQVSPGPDPSEFAVLVNGSARTVTDATVDDTTVILTLDPPVNRGDTVTVAYTA